MLRQNVDEFSAFWRRKKVFGRSYNSDQGLEGPLAIKDGRNSGLPKKVRCDLIEVNKQVGKMFY